MLGRLLVVGVLAGLSSGFLFGPGGHWSGLQVKWALPTSSTPDAFQGMPRTTEEATEQGWLAKSNFCQGPRAGPFRGYQYWKDSDPAVVLLFDRNGFIAGLQTGVSQADYTPAAWAQTGPFVPSDGLWLISVYFVKPFTLAKDGSTQDFICDVGRTSSDFAAQGTGNRFYIQNGTDVSLPSNLINIPLAESDLNPSNTNGWNFGKCFQTIGNNYWFNMSTGMDCEHMFPVNVIYAKGQLAAFSFLVNADLPSAHEEHFQARDAQLVMNPVPECLFSQPSYHHISAMHVFLNKCALNLCYTCT